MIDFMFTSPEYWIGRRQRTDRAGSFVHGPTRNSENPVDGRQQEAALTLIQKTPADEIVAESVRFLAELRARRPLVQAVTNYVSMDVAANVLLAIGASPAMVHAPEEADEFVALASALVVNIGTLSQPFVVSMEAAAAAAHRIGRPWVLDPVGVGATRFRDRTVEGLLYHKPQIIRGNASEIMSVARVAGLAQDAAAPKGVDSAHKTDDAREIAIALARHLNCVIAATGAVDLVTDGERIVELANGSPLMAKVTALGCSLSAVVAAFACLAHDRFLTAAAAIAVYGVAGEMAAERAARPGSFRVAFLDALDEIDEANIRARLKVG
jgi:hydroxyethylthiazole kinase